MNKQHWLLVAALCVVQAEVSAADIFKCKSADGKVTYRGQPAVEKGTKCEQMMQKKTGGQSITTIGQDAPPGANTNEMDHGGRPVGEQPPEVPVPPSSEATQKSADPAADAAKKKVDPEKAKQDQAKKQQQDEADRKIREKNCSAAQANLRQLQQGGRIATTNEKGEREYLSDADRGAKINEAQQDVDQWCSAK